MEFVMNSRPLTPFVDPLSDTCHPAAFADPVFVCLGNSTPNRAMLGFITLSMVISNPIPQ